MEDTTRPHGSEADLENWLAEWLEQRKLMKISAREFKAEIKKLLAEGEKTQACELREHMITARRKQLGLTDWRRASYLQETHIDRFIQAAFCCIESGDTIGYKQNLKKARKLQLDAFPRESNGLIHGMTMAYNYGNKNNYQFPLGEIQIERTSLKLYQRAAGNVAFVGVMDGFYKNSTSQDARRVSDSTIYLALLEPWPDHYRTVRYIDRKSAHPNIKHLPPKLTAHIQLVTRFNLNPDECIGFGLIKNYRCLDGGIDLNGACDPVAPVYSHFSGQSQSLNASKFATYGGRDSHAGYLPKEFCHLLMQNLYRLLLNNKTEKSFLFVATQDHYSVEKDAAGRMLLKEYKRRS